MAFLALACKRGEKEPNVVAGTEPKAPPGAKGLLGGGLDKLEGRGKAAAGLGLAFELGAGAAGDEA